MIWREETACRSCKSPELEVVIEFGETPLADRLLRDDQLDEPEPVVPLTLIVCRSCSLAQIRETVDPRALFGAEYPYFSSVSPALMRHFAGTAAAIMQRVELNESTLVVEAASNDGYLLRHFQKLGIPVLGVDPAVAPAEAAMSAGVPTLVEFFGIDLARRLTSEGRRAMVFAANNVLAHVPDLNGFVAGIAEVLVDDGVAVIEVPYVVDLVDHCEFDTIYHQHLCYFSLTALVPLFERHGLVLSDVERVPIHGGSLRLFIERGTAQRPSVTAMLSAERERGFDGPDAYRGFGDRVAALRRRLRELLDRAHADGARIVGYGAAAKATTLMAYCGIGRDDLEYVCDLSEFKQGRFMGGNHLPIRPPSALRNDPPDLVLVLAWNFADEIIDQNRWFADTGGRFLVPVPEPHVV